MKKLLLSILIGLISLLSVNAQDAEKLQTVYIIPIEGQISKAQLYILRRGLKQAIDNKVETVVLKIDTPGGELKTTLEMMEILDNFKGRTIAFVDSEAMSAGAYISAATDLIYMHPKAVIGAAAVIQATGTEVPVTLKEKIDSYLRARVRSVSKEHRYRSDVIRAMMDDKFEFKIGNDVIKASGSLLSLTADEATKKYGNPPMPLLAEGIVDSIQALLDQILGKGQYKEKAFELTWSEDLAKWLNSITPILLGLGLIALFIEFKTPGFGVFGISGIALLLIVFFSSYVAGLAGYEEILVFILGLVLLGVEVFLIPGTFIAGALGILLILGSLVWALADTWPTKEFKFTGDLFFTPLLNVVLGILIAVAGGYLIGKYLLKSWLWDKLVLKASVPKRKEPLTYRRKPVGPAMKTKGLAVTDLHPWGEIEVNGERYQAKAEIGSINKGSKIEVLDKDNFGLIVRLVEE